MKGVFINKSGSLELTLEEIKDRVKKYTDKVKSVCERNNNQRNNRCINCGAKSGHPCNI